MSVRRIAEAELYASAVRMYGNMPDTRVVVLKKTGATEKTGVTYGKAMTWDLSDLRVSTYAGLMDAVADTGFFQWNVIHYSRIIALGHFELGEKAPSEVIAKDPSLAKNEIDLLREDVRALGQALGEVLVGVGVIGASATVPELLIAAKTYCEGATWGGGGFVLKKE